MKKKLKKFSDVSKKHLALSHRYARHGDFFSITSIGHSIIERDYVLEEPEEL
jgi:hypothetical protein